MVEPEPVFIGSHPWPLSSAEVETDVSAAVLAMDPAPTPTSTASSTKNSSKKSSSGQRGHHRRTESDDLARTTYSEDSPRSRGRDGRLSSHSTENDDDNQGQYPPTQIVYNNTPSMSPTSDDNKIFTVNGHQQLQYQVPPPGHGRVPGFPHPPTQYQQPRDRSWSGGNPYSFDPMNGYPPYQASASLPRGQPPSRVYPHVGTLFPVAHNPMAIPKSQSATPPSPPSPTQLQPQEVGNSKLAGNPISNLDKNNKRKGYPGHRRVHSYNGTVSYGTIDGGTGQSTISGGGTTVRPLPPSRRSVGRNTGAEFSPLAEIRKLAAGGRNGAGPGLSPRPGPPPFSHSPVPPSPRSRRRGLSPHSRTMSEDFRNTTAYPPALIATDGTDFGVLQQQHRQLSPQIPPRVMTPGVYGTAASSGEEGSAMFMQGRARMVKYGSERGGEVVFSLNNNVSRSKDIGKSGGSRRKAHMRQKSAQLYMEAVKGTEQMPSCRDLIFLLLFVFHLLGIVYLGKTYGFESLPRHDEVQGDSSVTIMYTNIIYIAGLSGIFAVTISAMTLCLMMVVANKIVQIALAVAITFSFAWGTLGIGLSPKMVVPATGFVSLALSVGYAFIVWDRIPFAATNLQAGLTGIRANPGAVLLAFLFQFLALGWSIYYIYVVVGVYDAIQKGDIGYSYPWMKSIVYTLLGVSYCWTLQVFLVRDV